MRSCALLPTPSLLAQLKTTACHSFPPGPASRPSYGTLISRPETRDILGQLNSAFLMADVLRENKILLVNLAGLPAETASLVDTLLVKALRTAAQVTTPKK